MNPSKAVVMPVLDALNGLLASRSSCHSLSDKLASQSLENSLIELMATRGFRVAYQPGKGYSLTPEPLSTLPV